MNEIGLADSLDPEELQRLKNLGKEWKYPAWSCGEIKEKKPDYTSGYYWVEKRWHSSRLVYCDLQASLTNGCMRVANLDMSERSQRCPSGFEQVSEACRRSSSRSGCSSITFESHGNEYKTVCGTVDTRCRGRIPSNGFVCSSCGINDVYVDGISITYGHHSERKHLWTIASTCYRGGSGVSPHDFVGKSFSYQSRDPVSFCTDLSHPTTENLEVRICRDQDRDNEDVEVEVIQLCIY